MENETITGRPQDLADVAGTEFATSSMRCPWRSRPGAGAPKFTLLMFPLLLLDMIPTILGFPS